MLNRAKKQNIIVFIRYLLFFGEKKLFKFVILNLFLSIVLSSCCRTKETLNQNEREKIAAFFEELLLEHGGAYTLFGSKPMTNEPLVDTSEEAVQKLQQYLSEHPEIEVIWIDRKLEEGWKEWKRNPQNTLQKNFILAEVDLKDYKAVILLNVASTISVLYENYADFKKIVGCDFDPTELIQQLRAGKIDLWSRLLRDCKALGILLGYGYQNSCLFEKRMNEDCIEPRAPNPSENNDPRLKAEYVLNDKPFRIPIFVMLDESESKSLVAKYKKEREQIKAIYEGKDFLDVTLAKLRGS